MAEPCINDWSQDTCNLLLTHKPLTEIEGSVDAERNDNTACRESCHSQEKGPRRWT